MVARPSGVSAFIATTSAVGIGITLAALTDLTTTYVAAAVLAWFLVALLTHLHCLRRWRPQPLTIPRTAPCATWSVAASSHRATVRRFRCATTSRRGGGQAPTAASPAPCRR